MANTFAPYGFQQYQGGAGGAPTFAQSVRKIASTNTTKIFSGDPVIPVTSSATGYITQAAATNFSGANTVLAGVFVGCKYLSISAGKTIWSSWWPGNGDASGDIEAYVIDDPNSRFIVQTSGTFAPITGTLSNQTSGIQGQFAGFSFSSTGATSGNTYGGNNSTGRSTAYLSNVGSNATYTLPFIVVDYQTFPPGSNGADPTSQYCNVIVGFNNEVWRTNGASTGIA